MTTAMSATSIKGSDVMSAPWFTSLVTVLLLAVLLGAGGAAYDGFLSGQVMLNLLIDNAHLLVIAVGMGYVILAGGIDLSVGSVLALTTMIAAWLLNAGWHPLVVIAIVLSFGAVFGALQGALIHYFELQPFIVTLAGMFLARGLCYLISIESITIEDPLFVAASQAQLPFLGGFISPSAAIAVIVLIVAVWASRRTAFGRAVYAIGGNIIATAEMGINVRRVKLAVYALVGASAAVA